MIEKDSGLALVDNLRAILSMEVYFNFGNSMLFGLKIAYDIEYKGVFPPDSFVSRSDICTIDVTTCWTLFFDIFDKEI